MIYKALVKLPTDVPVDVIGAEIEAIKQRLQLPVCPAYAYVDRARPENSPIHDTLTWDDALLAERARRDEARTIIQMIVPIRNPNDVPPCNVHISIVTDDGETQDGYASVEYVAKRGDLREQVLRELLARVRGDLRNHAWLTEIEPILDAIAEVEQSMQRKELIAV